LCSALSRPLQQIRAAVLQRSSAARTSLRDFPARRFGTSTNPLCSRPQDDGFVPDYEFDTPVKRPHVGRCLPLFPSRARRGPSRVITRGRLIAQRARVSPRELTRVINFRSSGSRLLPRSVYVSIMTRILMSSQGSSRARFRCTRRGKVDGGARARSRECLMRDLECRAPGHGGAAEGEGARGAREKKEQEVD